MGGYTSARGPTWKTQPSSSSRLRLAIATAMGVSNATLLLPVISNNHKNINTFIPCLRIYVHQLTVKTVEMIVPNIIKHCNVALIHFKEGACRKFHDSLHPIVPLVDCAIQLLHYISQQVIGKITTLTAVATNATMVTSTIHTINLSWPWNVGKNLSNWFSNNINPPVKYRSHIAEMIRAFQ